MRHAILLLALAGCAESIAGPDALGDMFYNRRPFASVPAQYSGWYGEVEACLGVAGDYAAVDWFLADSISLANGTSHVGRWSSPNEITMVAQFAPTEWAVRIYMIQHVTQADSVRHADQGCMGG